MDYWQKLSSTWHIWLAGKRCQVQLPDLFRDVTLISCSYNTPQVTEVMLRSFLAWHGHGPFKALLSENSTNEDTARLLRQYGVPFIRNHGATHAEGVQKLFDRVASRYVLLVDTDITFNRSLKPLIAYFLEINAALMGLRVGDHAGFKLFPRMDPCFCLIDLDAMKNKGIRFFDLERIERSRSRGFYDPIKHAREQHEKDGRFYDVGSTFYEDAEKQGLKIIEIDIHRYITHYHALSWAGDSGCGQGAEHHVRTTMEKIYSRKARELRHIDLRGAFF